MFEQDLRNVLFRFDCPSVDGLRDYYWQHLSIEQRGQVEQHLKFCPHCSAELKALADFLSAAGPSSLPTVSSAAQRIMAELQIVIARLIAPQSRPELSLRGAAQEIMLFEADNLAISLNLERTTPEIWGLTGQVLSPDTAAFSASYARLTRAAGNVEAIKVTLDPHGGFVISRLSAGDYQLVISLPDRRIVVPSLELKP